MAVIGNYIQLSNKTFHILTAVLHRIEISGHLNKTVDLMGMPG